MDQKQIEYIIDKYQANPSELIQILLEIQRENHWLPKQVLEIVSKRLSVPLSAIYYIATFYKVFSLIPKGRHTISVCTGTACHLNGSQRILDTIQRITGIGPGEVDPEFKFSLETVNCLGCCALGPVMVINNKYYGKTQVSKMEEILGEYE